MYMPAPHKHKALQAGKDAKLNSWKEQKEGRDPTKRKAPVEPTAKPSAKKGNLRLSNSFKSALCTQMMTSDKEADDFFNAIMKAAEFSNTSTAARQSATPQENTVHSYQASILFGCLHGQPANDQDNH